MINQPEELKTVEQQIEAAQNRLTLMDKNYTRVQQLHASEEQAIAELQGTRNDLNIIIESLKSKKESLTTECVNLEKTKGQILSDISDAQIKFNDIDSNSKSKIKELENAKQNFSETLQSISDREAAVTLREESIKNIEREVINKYDKIKAFANQL